MSVDAGAVLDLSVNAVPLAVLLGFLAWLFVSAPWSARSTATAAAIAVVGATALALVVVTYLVGRAVATGE